jgi:UDP-glucose 4-epimerase
MRVLVTGGAGFIGSHLVEHLLAGGDEVTVLDDLSTGSIENLAGLRSHPGLEVVIGSILDRPLLARLTAGRERVYHLAAAVGVRLIVDQPLAGMRTNIHGTENVLDACLDTDAALLLVSTSEIYGKNTADRLDEGADRVLGSPLLSRWTYAAAKGIDEAFAHAYWQELGLRVSIVRLFNTVGPRQTGRYGMVVPTLIGQALRGEPLTVFGDGVPAIRAIADDPRSQGAAFNLGGAQEIAIGDLASRIVELLGSTSRVRLVPYDEAYPPGYEDMRRRVPDNTRSEELVGFIPRTGVDDIIRIVADDLRTRAGSLVGSR